MPVAGQGPKPLFYIQVGTRAYETAVDNSGARLSQIFNTGHTKKRPHLQLWAFGCIIRFLSIRVSWLSYYVTFLNASFRIRDATVLMVPTRTSHLLASLVGFYVNHTVFSIYGVIPQQAGIQPFCSVPGSLKHWIPACAGMTAKGKPQGYLCSRPLASGESRSINFVLDQQSMK
jgi:hypothetical protein